VSSDTSIEESPKEECNKKREGIQVPGIPIKPTKNTRQKRNKGDTSRVKPIVLEIEYISYEELEKNMVDNNPYPEHDFEGMSTKIEHVPKQV